MTDTDERTPLGFPEEYAPDQERLTYTLPATDPKGHADIIKVSVPQGKIVARVNAIVNSDRLGYRSPGDFYRRAIHVLLEMDEAETGLATSVGRQFEVLEALNQEADNEYNFQRQIADLTRIAERYLAEDEVDAALQYLHRGEAVINDFPEGPWKRKMLLEFNERFGGLMERVGE